MGFLFSSASLLHDTAEGEANQLFLHCNSKVGSLLTSTLCKHSQAQKALKLFSPVDRTISLEMSRIQILAAFLINSCF